MTTEPAQSSAQGLREFWVATRAYLLWYLAGIVSCVVFTPVDLTLIRFPIVVLYPPLAVVGYPLFYLYLDPQYVWGSTPEYWCVYWTGLAFGALAILAHLIRWQPLRCWRPALAGFTLGFIGTMGVYYSVAASI